MRLTQQVKPVLRMRAVAAVACIRCTTSGASADNAQRCVSVAGLMNIRRSGSRSQSSALALDHDLRRDPLRAAFDLGEHAGGDVAVDFRMRPVRLGRDHREP